MEGSTFRQPRILRVQQGFERSRLEHALLASAYEQVVPGIRCRRPARQGDTHQELRTFCDPQQTVSRGA